MALWLLGTTKDGAILGDGSPVPTLSGTQIILSELGQFNPSSAVIPGSLKQSILMTAAYSVVEAVQDNVGSLGSFVVMNSSQQIDQNDSHTITLDLHPLTVETTWERTGPDWKAVNSLSVVASRIASLADGWTGVFTGAGTADDIQISITHNNPTILAAYLDTAKTFNEFVRQGVDAAGVPIRVLEMGQFGAAPTITIQDPKGGDADEMAGNPLIRPVVSVDRTPNDVTNLVNVAIPYGGGQDIDSMVNLERLWKIINDPTYPGVGRYGTDAESIARTGKTSLFPEYDPNYPISDPKNPPTGVATFDSAGDLIQGFANTRGFSTGGRSLYYVYDAASYALYGHKMGEFIDSSLTYADNSVANQELTERALYVSTITNFKRRAHPHHAFNCTAPGTGRPTRAGDLIAIDVQRVSVGMEESAAVVEMDVQETVRVMRVTRAFGDTPPIDTYVTSNLGRFEDDDASAGAEAAKALVEIQRQQGTGLSRFVYPFIDNIDAANPITLPFLTVDEHFRYHRVQMQVDFLPFRGTATTATNIAGTPVISADAEVLINTPEGLNASPANIGGMPLHAHKMEVHNSLKTYTIPSVPINEAPTGYLWAANGDGSLHGNSVATFLFTSTDFAATVDLSDTAHPHVVAAANTVVAHIPAGQRIASLPLHVHDVEKRIPTGQPSPVSITVSINGLALSSGIAATGTRNSSGAFTSSTVINDIGPLLEAAGGTAMPIRFDAGVDAASNPFGIGRIQITITGVEELGGLTSNVQVN